MKIFPAIDLKDGKCVRLYQGDFQQQTVVNEDPIAQAREFAEAGATYIHVVDLDGALAGRAVNADLIRDLKKATGLRIEVGGGIRTMEQVRTYLAAGIERIIIGSAALNNQAFLREAVATYPEAIAVGIDAKDGRVAVSGWLDVSETDYLTFAKEVVTLGVGTIIYTDISRDGTLQGPNLAHYRLLQDNVTAQIVASGGVSSQQDLWQLAELDLYAAIVGKAFYSGRVTIPQMLEVENHAG